MAENQRKDGTRRVGTRQGGARNHSLATELGVIEQNILLRIEDFDDPRQEWRRLFSELYGTFLLVIVAAGGGMMSHAFPGIISRTAAVVGSGPDGIGRHPVHGQDLGGASEPCGQYRVRASRRLPVAPRAGLHRRSAHRRDPCLPAAAGRVGVSATYGSNYPAAAYSAGAAFWMEALLTLGLVSVILGTASGAQNVGLLGAFG